MKTLPITALVVSQRRTRDGGALLVAAGGLLIALGCAAFAVDLGFIALSKAQLQTAADAAALGAAMDFDVLAVQDDVDAAVRDGAIEVASLHRAAGMDSVLLDWADDVEVGRSVWNPTTKTFEESLTASTAPLNLVKVKARLKQFDMSDGTVVDRRVPLFFARVFGHDTANMEAAATAAVLPGIGFRIQTNSNKRSGILPFAFDEQTWLALIAGTGPDQYSYNAATKQVVSGSDGVRELNLYPEGSVSLPAGNRGTIDLGSSNNSTSDIARQILEGMNADDFEAFGGEIRTDNGPIVLNGDTGISAGFKEELESIIGEKRAIPLFTQVAAPGNNAVYTIVRFVGIRVLAVKLTGSNKYLKVQPAHFIDSTVIPSTTTVTIWEPGTILTAPRLIK